MFLAFCGSTAIAGEAEMKDLIESALRSKGEEYIALRDRIVARGGAAVAELGRRRTQATDWRERLLVDVIVERVEKGEAIRQAIKGELPSVYSRRSGDQIQMSGKAWAERFEEFPLVLVEFVWKGNELSRRRPRGALFWEYPYAIAALGILKEPRAMPVLLELLESYDEAEHRPDPMYAIFYAIEQYPPSEPFLRELIRIAEAAGELMKSAETEEQWRKPFRVRRSAWQLIWNCASVEMAAFLMERAKSARDEYLRAYLSRIAWLSEEFGEIRKDYFLWDSLPADTRPRNRKPAQDTEKPEAQ